MSGMAPELRDAIRELVRLATTQHMAHPADRTRLGAVEELVTTALRALGDDIDLGQVKLMRRALREMRASFTLFNHHRSIRKVAVFGSARTPPDHPDYSAAHVFTRTLADRGWMAITGAGPGIMQAGIEGPSPEQAFGLAIRLPYEQKPVEAIRHDPKLLEFRHFFTRKLAFMGSADAVAAFPGGYGTQDELFEALTLVQCGRNAIVPIVLVEGVGLDGKPLGYWARWETFMRDAVFASGWVDADELALYRIAANPTEAADIVTGFYRRYRSSRWVGELFVVRLDAPLPDGATCTLAQEFRGLLESGTIEQGTSLEGDDAPDRRGLRGRVAVPENDVVDVLRRHGQQLDIEQRLHQRLVPERDQPRLEHGGIHLRPGDQKPNVTRLRSSAPGSASPPSRRRRAPRPACPRPARSRPRCRRSRAAAPRA